VRQCFFKLLNVYLCKNELKVLGAAGSCAHAQLEIGIVSLEFDVVCGASVHLSAHVKIATTWSCPGCLCPGEGGSVVLFLFVLSCSCDVLACFFNEEQVYETYSWNKSPNKALPLLTVVLQLALQHPPRFPIYFWELRTLGVSSRQGLPKSRPSTIPPTS